MTVNKQKTSPKAEDPECIPWELFKKISDELLEKNREVYEALARSDAE